MDWETKQRILEDYQNTVDTGLKDAKWCGRDYADMVLVKAEEFTQQYKLHAISTFDLCVLLGNAYRAGYLAGATTKGGK